MLFEQLSDIGFKRGRGITSITVGVLMIQRGYKDRKKLEALAKLSGEEGGFGDIALKLEARRILLPLLERAHEADEGVTRRTSSTASTSWDGHTYGQGNLEVGSRVTC